MCITFQIISFIRFRQFSVRAATGFPMGRTYTHYIEGRLCSLYSMRSRWLEFIIIEQSEQVMRYRYFSKIASKTNSSIYVH
jgi:hypothetical protein